MFRFARHRLRSALLALCGLLLAQWSLAAHACPQIRPAHAHGSQHERTMAPAVDTASAVAHDCHHAGAVPDGGVQDCSDAGFDRTLCQKHCDDDGQSGSPAPLVAIDAPATAPLRISAAPAHRPPPAAGAPDGGDATAPPFTILYCVFLS